MGGSATTVLRDADVVGIGRVDVLVRDGVVAVLEAPFDNSADDVVDCAGAALLPGLHDHHLHLLAAAATERSVACGPPTTRDRAALRAALRSADVGADGWIRGVGYDESVAGELDAAALDAMRADVPIRVQHRSGAAWSLNSPALGAVDAHGADVAGIERDGAGLPTGRLWRLDGWLRDRLPSTPTIGLAELSRRLSSFGITGVTDATPGLSTAARRSLADPDLQQHVTLLGDPDGAAPYKIVIADHALPAWDELVEQVSRVRPRAVAVHAVTRAALALALGVLEHVGVVVGDRVEHAAVTPPELAQSIARLGLPVVTQPSFVHLRGDDYLARVDADDLPHLWPYRSLLDVGVRVACSSDAPYGDLDPWSSIGTAATRCSSAGRFVAPDQAVSACEALRGYLGAAADPGGPVRTIRTGATADLALLDRPLSAALADPPAVTVRATWIDGRRVWGDP